MIVQSYRFRRAAILALTCCLALSSSIGLAQTKPVETLLPKDPFLVVTWDGIEPHRESYKKTAAYESLHDSGLADVLNKWINIAVAKAPAKEAARIRKLVDRMIKTGLSMSITSTSSPDAKGPPLPHVLFVVHEGAELETDFAESIATLAEEEEIKVTTEKIGSRTIKTIKIPKSPPGFELGWWAEGKHLILTGGFGALKAVTSVADGESPNITASDVWKKYHVSGEPAGFELSMIGWLDVAAVLKTYGDIPLPDQPNRDQPLTINVLAKALGLDGLQRLVFQRGYLGKATRSVSTLETLNPRTGLLAMCEGPDMSLADLPPIPAGCMAFYAESCDFSKAYTELVETLRRVAKLGPPGSSDGLEQQLTALPNYIGFDLKADLVDTLGNIACIYNDSTNGYIGIGPTIILKLKDSAKFSKTFETILKEHATPGILEVKQAERNGHTVKHLLIGRSGFGPAVGIEKDWLVIGLTPQIVEAFTLRLDKKLDRWEPGADEKESLAGMPQKFTSICVTHPHKLYSTVVSFAPTILMFAEIALRENRVLKPGERLPFSAADIPPAELVDRPLFPRVTIGTSSKDGFRWTTRSSGPTE